jgi:transposase
MAADSDALVFTSPAGHPLRHASFRRRVWLPALSATGLDFHLHDLRHTGNNLAAEGGASLRDLMDRMGHATTRAAQIYQHSTSDRQRAIADALASRIHDGLRTAAEWQHVRDMARRTLTAMAAVSLAVLSPVRSPNEGRLRWNGASRPDLES